MVAVIPADLWFYLFGGRPSQATMTMAVVIGAPIIGALIGWLFAKVIIRLKKSLADWPEK